jgi:UDP-N-acetylmuramoylalanine--D-glutamate ligase
MMSLPPDYFAGKKITVMGLGHFGGQIAVIRYLIHQGAVVTVTDVATEEKLKESLEILKGLDVIYHLGGHLESDFTDADMVVVSPAVSKDSRYLKLAAQKSVSLTCEMNLFLDRCRGKVMAVTGTVGKSTTLGMIESILAAAEKIDFPTLGFRKFWCGGNIGKSLLEEISSIHTNDVVALELSSFQLDDMSVIEYSPDVALVTNIHPNHLDRHGTLESYIDAKANITRFQQPGDHLITRINDESLEKIRDVCPPQVVQWYFGEGDDAGLKVRLVKGCDGHLCLEYRKELGGEWEKLIDDTEIHVPGEHNMYNAAGAASACMAIGITGPTIAQGLRDFKGLADRLQLVGEFGQVRWFNDSKSTTPESGMVALKSFKSGSIIAIAGGYDKGSDLTNFGQQLAAKCRMTYCLGQTGDTIASTIRSAGGTAENVTSLEEAVEKASKLAEPGQVVLLSPGCASWDMFENYQQRGRLFAEAARKYSENK